MGNHGRLHGQRLRQRLAQRPTCSSCTGAARLGEQEPPAPCVGDTGWEHVAGPQGSVRLPPCRTQHQCPGAHGWHQLGQDGWSHGAVCFPCSTYTGHENWVIFHSRCSALSLWLFSLQPQTNTRARSPSLSYGCGANRTGWVGVGWDGTPPALLEVKLTHDLQEV